VLSSSKDVEIGRHHRSGSRITGNRWSLWPRPTAWRYNDDSAADVVAVPRPRLISARSKQRWRYFAKVLAFVPFVHW